MLLNFRQGIVDSQKNPSGQPSFLQMGSTTVSINATNTPVTLSIANGRSNYLVTIEQDVPDAWKGFGTLFPIGVKHWLYMDINPVSGKIVYGVTSLQPVDRVGPPTQPKRDQHWFDTTATKMKVWSGAAWLEKIRIILGMVTTAATVQPNPFGTQVGLTGEVRVGKIVFDDSGRPIRKSNGELFTTEDDIYVSGVIAAPNSLETRMLPVNAGESISKYAVVKLSAFDTVRLAAYADTTTHLLGIAQQSIPNGQSGNIILQGFVDNPAWNWPAVGAPLWVDRFGQLTATDPAIANPTLKMQPPVAQVIRPSRIRFAPAAFAVVPEAGADGAAGSLEIGEVATGEPGTDVIVENTGTESAAVLNITIPRGADGEDGVDGVTPTITIGTVESGTEASVTNTGTAPDVVLNFVIPKGEDGVDADAIAPGITSVSVTGTVSPTTMVFTEIVGTSAVTRTLPAPNGANAGHIVFARNISSGDVEYLGHIDGVADSVIVLPETASIGLQSTGTTWFVISN